MSKTCLIGAVALVCTGIAPVAFAELELPDGFSAVVVHEGLGTGRHLVVRSNGDLYLAGRNGLVAMRDTDGDGKADVVTPFGDVKGTAVHLFQGALYASDDVAVYRYVLKDGELVPSGARETIVSGFPLERQHSDKTFAMDAKGMLYVNVGAPSNACQEKDRQPGSLGMTPCPILEKYGGIWRFDGTKLNQSPADGKLFATGIRNAVALEWSTAGNGLYSVVHGRDAMDTLFPQLFNATDNATRPAEEFHLLVEGGHYGWPFTFFDTKSNKRVLGPEYGGDGKKEPEAGKYAAPLVAFPAHWAPNDLLFHSGKGLPAKYKDGAFIAFHGSWNRAPEPQAGYKVVFQPMKNGKPNGKYEVFADGFAGALAGNNPRNAKYRPVGLAEALDGALYISDSQQGRIWRIRHEK